MLLKNCRFVVTQNSNRAILENIDILVQENKIVAIEHNLDNKYPNEKIIDCSNRIVMPGLINSHMHLAMTELRGMSDDVELKDWLDVVIAAEKEMDDGDKYTSALSGMQESVRNGTTTMCDMYAADDMTIEVAKIFPVRLVKIQSYFSAFTKVTPEDIFYDITEKVPANITIALGPHSIYGTDEELLKYISKVSVERNILVQMHLSETRPERAEFKTKHGCLPVEYLEKIGFLNKNVMLVHAVWLTKQELDILAKYEVSVVHCPQSNMKLAGGGVMPLSEMLDRKINVCLGTDSAVSNNALDMFREMHVCSLLHKHHYWNPKFGESQQMLDMATINAANAIGRTDLGSLESGKIADIITLDLADYNLKPFNKDNAISNLVHSANGMNVSEVIIDGKLVLNNKKFC